MTPEERATALLTDRVGWPHNGAGPTSTLHRGVTAAIREAEACALFRAAEHLEFARVATHGGLLGDGLVVAVGELRRLAAETRKGAQ
jgi:hypothetical protein